MNGELLKEILARPDDDAPRLVYADALLTAGDPRGELITLQCELARQGASAGRLFHAWIGDGLAATDVKALRKREAALLRKHGGEWTREARPFAVAGGVILRRGFVEHRSSKIRPQVCSRNHHWRYELSTSERIPSARKPGRCSRPVSRTHSCGRECAGTRERSGLRLRGFVLQMDVLRDQVGRARQDRGRRDGGADHLGVHLPWAAHETSRSQVVSRRAPDRSGRRSPRRPPLEMTGGAAVIIRQYRIRCPRCQQGTVRVRDVPSVASVNNYLPPDSRKPVPEGDRWRYSVLEDCPVCGESSAAIGSVLDRDGLPEGTEADRS